MLLKRISARVPLLFSTVWHHRGKSEDDERERERNGPQAASCERVHGV